MKANISKLKIFSIIICFFIIISKSYSFETNIKSKHPTIQISETKHDFGKFNQSINYISHSITFKNIGNSPLIIYKTISSCSCTQAYYSKIPIASGKESKITLTYCSANRPGFFQKTVTVYTNDPEHKQIKLKVQGYAIPKPINIEKFYPINLNGFRINTKSITMPTTEIGKRVTQEIKFINTTDKYISLNYTKAPIFISTASKKAIQPHEKGTIIIYYYPSKANSYGKRKDFFYIKTNNAEQKITVTATIIKN